MLGSDFGAVDIIQFDGNYHNYTKSYSQVAVPIINDDIAEQKEYFTCSLFSSGPRSLRSPVDGRTINVNFQGPGVPNPGNPSLVTIEIHDDDGEHVSKNMILTSSVHI